MIEGLLLIIAGTSVYRAYKQHLIECHLYDINVLVSRILKQNHTPME